MKKLMSVLFLVGSVAPLWAGTSLGLGSAVARQSGKTVKESQDIAAASSLPACTEAASYSVSPIDTSVPFNMEPLGHMSGSSHLFPTDHVYFIIGKATDTAPTTPVYAPGAMRITGVAASLYLNATPPFTDYALTFSPCQGLNGKFGHVAELSSKIAAAIGDIDKNCFTYSDGSTRYCSKSISVNVAAGETIGSIVGRVGSSIYSLDLGAYDYTKPALAFIDTTRRIGDGLYTRCPLDEYEEPLKTSLLARMGNYDGTKRRTAEPVCGTILEDVAGTAQGLWYVNGTPMSAVQSEAPHLALVHDNVTPSTGVFSVGTSVGNGLPAQQYYFTPTTSGLVNLDFNLVTSNTNVYCYDTTALGYNFIFLVQLPTATTLKFENQTAASCGSGPWSFTANAVSFER